MSQHTRKLEYWFFWTHTHTQLHTHSTRMPGRIFNTMRTKNRLAFQLADKLLQYDPTKRLTAAQALEDEWFAVPPGRLPKLWSMLECMCVCLLTSDSNRMYWTTVGNLNTGIDIYSDGIRNTRVFFPWDGLQCWVYICIHARYTHIYMYTLLHFKRMFDTQQHIFLDIVRLSVWRQYHVRFPQGSKCWP